MRSDRLKQVMLQLDPNFNEKDLGYSKFSKFLSDAVARNCLTLKKLDNGQWEVAPAVEGATEAKPEEESAGREDGRRSRGRGRDRGRDRSASRREETATASEAKAGSEKQAKEEAPEAGSEKTEAKVEPRARKVEARNEPKAEDTVEATGDPLTAAYDLLCRAVAAVAGSTGAAARDSDVKRRMLEFESGWDESTLGFSKFSRFLRQAHDAEVIDLRKVGNGTYEVVLPSGRASSEEAEPRGRKGSRTSSRSTRSEKSSSETAATKKSTASSKSTAMRRQPRRPPRRSPLQAPRPKRWRPRPVKPRARRPSRSRPPGRRPSRRKRRRPRPRRARRRQLRTPGPIGPKRGRALSASGSGVVPEGARCSPVRRRSCRDRR